MAVTRSSPVRTRHEGEAPRGRSACGWRHLLVSCQDDAVNIGGAAGRGQPPRPRPAESGVVELASWPVVVNVLLDLDEVLMKR
jgi:hypothetical protein